MLHLAALILLFQSKPIDQALSPDPLSTEPQPRELRGWSWRDGFFQPDSMSEPTFDQATPWVCGSTLVPDQAAVQHLLSTDCSYQTTNPLEIYAPSNGKFSIPCVVHVITDGALGWVELPCVQGAIEALNNDFLAITGTPGQNGLDSQIEFFLPQVDEEGNPSTGVTYTSNPNWFYETDPNSETSVAYRNALSWDPNFYLNIYVLNTQVGAGYAFLPVDPCDCVVGNRDIDGVHIQTNYFGSCGALMNGRVLSHEVGHYLGLFHTFEDGCASGPCQSTGDRICDTNRQAEGSYGFDCNNYQSCGSPDPDRNYMNYGDGTCFQNFTSDQIRRMRCVLENYRPQLGILGIEGSCCFSTNGTCLEISDAECSNSGGSFEANSTCDVVDCDTPPFFASCCLPDGQCVSYAAPSTCLQSGGDLIIGQGCSAVQCDEGACCLLTGGCVKTTQGLCSFVYQGTYLGNQTNCVNDGCLLTACCLSNGDCILAEQLECLNIYQGIPESPGTLCGQTECDRGSCCLPSGDCLFLGSESCQASGGQHSPNETCSETDCSQPCPEDLDLNGSIGYEDLIQLLSVWGQCAGCAEDLDGNKDVDYEDLLLVLSKWGPCV